MPRKDPEEARRYRRAYNQRPEVKARQREKQRKRRVQKGDEMRRYFREWHARNPGKAAEYNRRRNAKPGERQRNRERDRRWYEQNKDRNRARGERWREANPERAREITRRSVAAWRAANPERSAEIQARYERPLEVRIASGRRRRELERGVRPDDGGLAREYQAILHGDPCAYCGAPADHIDHIDALRTGGTGDWDNLTAACKRCNMRKQSRPLLVFLTDPNRLLPLRGEA